METMKEKLIQWIVWRLPRSVVYWAMIRAANETREDYPAEQIVLDVLERWRKNG